MEKDCLQRLLEEGCGEAERFFKCGVELYHFGLLENAVLAWDKGIELDSTNAAFFHNRGTAKMNLGKSMAAICDFDQVIKLEPTDAGAYLARGLSKKDLGSFKSAIGDFNRAIELGINDASAFFLRGVAKKELGNLESAIADYDEAIALGLNDSETFHFRGVAKAQLGRKEEAIKDFDKAIEIDHEDIYAFNGRGVANYELGNSTAAILDYNKAIELTSNFGLAFSNRGSAKWDLGLSYEARQDFYRAIFLFSEEDLKKELLKLLQRFHSEIQAPFQVQALLQVHFETETHLSFQTLISENTRQCHPLNTLLDWLTAAQNLPSAEADWLRSLVHYLMGDPIGAFGLLTNLNSEDTEKTNFVQQHFLLRAADDILHDDRESIRASAVEKAVAFAENGGNDPRQVYWASRILHYDGEYWLAAECLEKGDSNDLFNLLAQAESLEAGEEDNSAALAGVQEIIDKTGIAPEDYISSQRLSPDSADWLFQLEKAVQFYDMELFISREFGVGEIYPRFWEIWDSTDLETALREKRLAESLARLQKKFGDDMERVKSDPIRLSLLSLGKSGDEYIEVQKDLDTYVFCKFGEVSRDELFYLRVFQMNFIHESPGFPGTAESSKSFLENLIKSTLELSHLAAPVLSPLSAGFAQAMTALAGGFLSQNIGLSTEDRVGQYQKFKANFQSYIFEQIAEIGEEEFYRRYLIRGFDRF